MAIQDGVNIAKFVGYAVLGNPEGVFATRLQAYVVIGQTNVNPPIWPELTFTTGVVGVAYSQDWDLTPAAPPTTYTLVAGALPNGLVLTNVSGNIGRLGGIPTLAGTFNFTLRATNMYGSADKSFTMDVVEVAAAGGPVAMGWAA